MPKLQSVSRAVPIRASLALLKDAQRLAAECGYSFNAFMVGALKGTIEMIEAPEGQVMEPEMVAIARHIRKMRQGERQPILPRHAKRL